MTVELIRIGAEDTNNYEQDLEDFGYGGLDNSIKEDIIAVWKFLCNEELVLNGLKKFSASYFDFCQKEKSPYANFSMTGEVTIISIIHTLLKSITSSKRVPNFNIQNTHLFCMAN